MNKKNKKIIKYSIITSIILIIICYHEINVLASFPGEFYKDENFIWEIDSINDGNNLWYNVSNFDFIANWHANISDEITFTVDDYSTIEDEDYLIGDLIIGNLSINSNNKDIGFNLALSAYPWYGGLVSLETNWDSLILDEPFNGPNAEISFDRKINVLGEEINAVRINYDDGFQESTLYYDPITGVLLKANTTSGSFNLDLHLIYSSMPLPSITSGLPIFVIFTTISGLGVIFVIFKTKKIKRRI